MAVKTKPRCYLGRLVRYRQRAQGAQRGLSVSLCCRCRRPPTNRPPGQEALEQLTVRIFFSLPVHRRGTASTCNLPGLWRGALRLGQATQSNDLRRLSNRHAAQILAPRHGAVRARGIFFCSDGGQGGQEPSNGLSPARFAGCRPARRPRGVMALVVGRGSRARRSSDTSAARLIFACFGLVAPKDS